MERVKQERVKLCVSHDRGFTKAVFECVETDLPIRYNIIYDSVKEENFI